ncbi:fumarylacetoacetate hydrolase family protein [Kribbella sp. NPDC051586]|uniref:fumarylacetoacetate hydrolase family protein n=1 Tax=Kribbella sp. NPDC051586 TaxID=3364118 RepID=UPI0037B8B6CC
MRIARFSVDDEPKYGVVETDDPEGLVGTVNVLDSDPLYRPVQFTGERLQLADVRLLAPVIPRSKVVCVGRNYAAHAQELGNDVPTQPMIFLKPNTSVIGPRDGIVYPEQTSDLHFEGELAIVIGRICRDLPKERVNEVIFGYTIANDVTARDLQKTDGQWARAKGYDTFCPLGPWISTELDASDLRVSTELNGELKQDGRTSQFIFDIPEVLAYITSFTTLLPGDVVLTGTPAGVGPMLPGDEVSVSVEGIGTLTNKVIVRD